MVAGIHYGGPAVYNGAFRNLFPQETFAPEYKGATVSAHKFRTHSSNSRGILFGGCFADTCCECGIDNVTEALPSSALMRYLSENGGWPRVTPSDPQSAYEALPIVGLVHMANLQDVYWNVLAPKDGVTFELVLFNGEVNGVVADACGDGSTVDCPGNELGGSSGEVVLATIDGSIGGCSGCREGQGLVDLDSLGIVSPNNVLRWNDWIGLRPTALPTPAEGEDPVCAIEGFGIMVSAVQAHYCKGA